MKVLLVNPPDLFLRGDGRASQLQPLGLASVGAYVAEAHDVRFLLPNTRAYRGDDPWGEIRRAIAAESPDVVGITAVTAQYLMACKTAQAVKAVDPAITTVLGGVHVTAQPVAALEHGAAFDYAIRGEGEGPFRQLLGHLAADSGSPADVAGLIWRDGPAIRVNAPGQPIADLDQLPVPLREGLVWADDIDPVFYQPVITVRGCPYQCIYCAVPNSNERQTRFRSVGHVLDEIEALVQHHAIPGIFFHDSVFTMHRKRTMDLCRGLIERGLARPFYCQTRVERVDPELLDVMAEAGCEQIFFGIESGDVESLRRIKKKVSLATIRQAGGWVKEREIRCTGFFMVGFPWETEESIQTTIDFACDLGLDGISLFSATPLPGTELWDMSGGDHLPESIDFTTPQVNLTSMPLARYRDVFDRARARVDRHNQAVCERRFRAQVPDAPPVDWIQRQAKI